MRITPLIRTTVVPISGVIGTTVVRIASVIMGEEDSSALQKDLDTLTVWESKWDMQFNPCKCQVVQVTASKSKKPINSEYILHGQILDTVTCVRYLGVDVSSALIFFNLHYHPFILLKFHPFTSLILTDCAHLQIATLLCTQHYKASIDFSSPKIVVNMIT